MLGISDVTAQEGADDIIVVGAPKHLNFTGGGAVEAGDQAIWASGAKVDADCLVDVFLDGPESTVDALHGADFFIPDEDGETKAGNTYTLCYRFGWESVCDEPVLVNFLELCVSRAKMRCEQTPDPHPTPTL